MDSTQQLALYLELQRVKSETCLSIFHLIFCLFQIFCFIQGDKFLIEDVTENHSGSSGGDDDQNFPPVASP